MSVVLSGSGAMLRITGTLWSLGFSICGFFKFSANGQYQVLFTCGDTSALGGSSVECGVNDSGSFYCANNVSFGERNTYASDGLPATLTDGTYYYFTLTVQAFGSGGMVASICPVGGTLRALTAYTSGDLYAGPFTEARFSNSPFGTGTEYQWPGSMGPIKAFAAVLSGGDLAAEGTQEAAVRTSGLFASWQMATSATATADSSGNSHPLTLTGTATTAAGPFLTLADGALAVAVSAASELFTVQFLDGAAAVSVVAGGEYLPPTLVDGSALVGVAVGSELFTSPLLDGAALIQLIAGGEQFTLGILDGSTIAGVVVDSETLSVVLVDGSAAVAVAVDGESFQSPIVDGSLLPVVTVGGELFALPLVDTALVASVLAGSEEFGEPPTGIEDGSILVSVAVGSEHFQLTLRDGAAVVSVHVGAERFGDLPERPRQRHRLARAPRSHALALSATPRARTHRLGRAQHAATIQLERWPYA